MARHRAWLRALILCSLAFSAAAAERGRLCIDGNACGDYACGQPVVPADIARIFQFTSGAAHYLGVLHAGESAITCDRYATLQMRITGPNFRRGSTARTGITDEALRTWHIVLADAAETLRLPRGTYVIGIESAHYRSIRRTVHVGDKPETFAAALEPLSVLTGRVLERETARGVGGAVITTVIDTTTIADGNGAFSIEADPGRWPATMTVSAAGYARTVVTLPKARKSAVLDDVVLSRGGSIAVEIIHPNPTDVVQIELRKPKRGSVAGSSVRTVPFSAGVSRVARFDNVEPGRYVIIAKGIGPCERRGEVVEIAAAEEKSLQMRVEPIRLRLRGMMAGEPLAGAAISFTNREGHWQANLETGETGEVATTLWQTGKAMAKIHVEDLMTFPYLEERTIPHDEELEWILEVVPRRITGVVIDSRSGSPVPDAVLSLKVRDEQFGIAVRVRSDARGRFQFMPVPHGRHTITAASATHLQGQVTYLFQPPEESRDVTVRLDSGASVRLHVTDAAGAPVSGAVAMQYKGLMQTRLSETDASGVAEVIVPEGETRDVYVVPRDGSFGVVRVTSQSKDPSIRLPRSISRIEIRAESESRQPIPNVSVVMRYNRQVLPREVVQELGRMQGARITSRADGRIVFDHMPSGFYEFWPAGSAAEMRTLFAGMGPRAPVTMNVAPGDNVAVLTFEPVHP